MGGLRRTRYAIAAAPWVREASAPSSFCIRRRLQTLLGFAGTPPSGPPDFMSSPAQAGDFGTYDYIIAGGGTAGCVLANRLSADPQCACCCSRRAASDDWIWIHIPVGYLYCIGNPRTDWCYRTEPEPGLNGRSILVCRAARCSAAARRSTACSTLRGQARDYDEWARADAAIPAGAGTACCRYSATARTTGAAPDDVHGARAASGASRRQRLHWDILDALREAARAGRHPAADDFNRGDNCGHRAIRSEPAARRALERGQGLPAPGAATGRNLRVITGALGRSRAARRQARAVGVEFVPTATRTVRARRAARDPAGRRRDRHAADPAALRHRRRARCCSSTASPSRTTCRGVGDNLQDHLQLRMVFRVDGVATLNTDGAILVGQGAHGAANTRCCAAARCRMAPSPAWRVPRAAIRRSRTPTWSSTCSRCRWTSSATRCTRFPAFTASVCNLRPDSRGYVSASRSADPRDRAARSRSTTCRTDEDRRIAAQSLRLTRRIVRAAGPGGRIAPAGIPARDRRSQTTRNWRSAAGNIGTTIFHPVGTCKMGRADDPAAVVDPRAARARHRRACA